jgi:L-methionine (R)-S-oxide reductase
MDEAQYHLIKLQDLSQFLASGSLDDDLSRQAGMTARLMGAESCSIMLLNGTDGAGLRMTVCASFGPLPAAALAESSGSGEGVAGHVLATGHALLLDDISNSELAKWARRPDDARRSLMSSPVRIDGKIVGVVNVCGIQARDAFRPADLHLLEVVALFIGKSIQVIQLQNILDSRFTQLALMNEVREKVGGSINTAYRNPDEVARILAKSFFKEMTKAGFGSGQIVRAAAEIIDQLNGNLQRHSKRVARNSDTANVKKKFNPGNN